MWIRDYTELYLWDTGSVGKVGVVIEPRSCYMRMSLNYIIKYIRIFTSVKLVYFKI